MRNESEPSRETTGFTEYGWDLGSSKRAHGTIQYSRNGSHGWIVTRGCGSGVSSVHHITMSDLRRAGAVLCGTAAFGVFLAWRWTQPRWTVSGGIEGELPHTTNTAYLQARIDQAKLKEEETKHKNVPMEKAEASVDLAVLVSRELCLDHSITVTRTDFNLFGSRWHRASARDPWFSPLRYLHWHCEWPSSTIQICLAPTPSGLVLEFAQLQLDTLRSYRSSWNTKRVGLFRATNKSDRHFAIAHGRFWQRKHHASSPVVIGSEPTAAEYWKPLQKELDSTAPYCIHIEALVAGCDSILTDKPISRASHLRNFEADTA
jgi:hypothetical protein